jgi:hypothetical protein
VTLGSCNGVTFVGPLAGQLHKRFFLLAAAVDD